jgi:hypothetical protein
VVSGHGQVVAGRPLERLAARQPRVQLTPRDLSILRDVVRFGALTVDQIGRRHFGSVLTAYGRLKALVDAGYLRGERVFYHRPAAYIATRAGAEAAGTNLPPARTAVAQLRHHLLVADLAEWLLDGHPRADWVTERELRARAMSGARDTRSGRLVGGVPHVPDGCLVHPDGRHVAIELECSPKWGNRYGVVLRFYADGEYDAVRWFVEGASLRQRLADLVGLDLLDDLISVEALPDALGGSTWAATHR